MRSLLFVPGDNVKKLEKAMASGADVVIIDLEDSVAAGAKPAARRIAAEHLGNAIGKTERPRFYVRINDLASGEAKADLDAVMPHGPDGIVLPKAIGGRDVAQLGARLAVCEAEYGLVDGVTRILAIATETAASIFALGTFAIARSRLSGLAWGAEDLAAELGVESNREENGEHTGPFRLVRNLALFAASAAEVAAIDGIFADYRDGEGLKKESRIACRDGFYGKLAIHPAQVPVINEAFTPLPQDIARARAIVAAFAAVPDCGVLAFEGRMIDRPHLKQAERLLKRIGSVPHS